MATFLRRRRTRPPPPTAMEPEQKKVLVVEDMASVAAVIQAALEGEGYEVEWVSSAERALISLANPPALLITDVELPRASGLDLLVMMRGRLPQLPVIVMSADAAKLAEARRRGAASVLAKPFPLETLRRVVRLALA